MEIDKEAIQDFRDMQERLGSFKHIAAIADKEQRTISSIIAEEAFAKVIDGEYPSSINKQEKMLVSASFHLHSIDINEIVEYVKKQPCNIENFIDPNALEFYTSANQVSSASFADVTDKYMAGIVDKPSQAKQYCLLFVKSGLRPVDAPDSIAITDDGKIHLNTSDEEFIAQVNSVAKNYQNFLKFE